MTNYYLFVEIRQKRSNILECLLFVEIVHGYYVDGTGGAHYLSVHESNNPTTGKQAASDSNGQSAKNGPSPFLERADTCFSCCFNSLLHFGVRFVMVPRAPASLLPSPPLVEAGASLPDNMNAPRRNFLSR